MPESQVPFRVLVIEDDEAARSATAGALREHMHTVFEAADGAAGLEIATTETLDAIVLDLMLPRMDGITLLEKLRQRSAIPVIITSAKQTENDRVNLLDMGADDYLTKPFTVRELLARLRAIVRRAEGDTTSVITIGDLAIDCHAKKVTRGGESIALTAMEFEVLAILAKHKGRIVSRALLEKAIHPNGSEQVSNVVDVFVLRLRRKLGNNLITTRRGQGFVIDRQDNESHDT